MDPRLKPDTDTPDSLGELLPKQSTFTNSPYFTSNPQEINFITPETENINETLRTYYHPNQPFSAPLGENRSAGPVIGIYFPLQGNPSFSAPLLLNTPNSPFRPVSIIYLYINYF